MKKFTDEELRKYDGSKPKTPLYIAYKGKVYDVTSSSLFDEGMHFEHCAGADLTEFLEEASHGEEVLEGLTVVGEYEE